MKRLQALTKPGRGFAYYLGYTVCWVVILFWWAPLAWYIFFRDGCGHQ